MITVLGLSVATTVAAVRAGKSAYAISEYETEEGKPYYYGSHTGCCI